MMMRFGADCPADAIRAMFGDDGSSDSGVRKITFAEFVAAGPLTGAGRAAAKGRRRAAK